jgi:hypothetical protein
MGEFEFTEFQRLVNLHLGNSISDLQEASRLGRLAHDSSDTFLDQTDRESRCVLLERLLPRLTAFIADCEGRAAGKQCSEMVVDAITRLRLMHAECISLLEKERTAGPDANDRQTHEQF